MKRAFTLLEVCLAVTVMSAGVLSVVALYSMGFRETRQSREDVATAAYADAVMSPLVNALSDTNLTWTVFRDIEEYPEYGWGDYFDHSTGLVDGNMDGTAKTTFKKIADKVKVKIQWPNSTPAGLKAGLVIVHDDQKPAVIGLAFRATRTPSMLMSAPMYYTEVHFQGNPEQ